MKDRPLDPDHSYDCVGYKSVVRALISMQFVLDSLLREKFMYRQHLTQQEMAEKENQFLTCVGDLPIVQSAWTQVSGIYTKTKEYNPLINYTLGMAESGVMKVVGTAQPLVQKYDGPIKFVNSVACNQLSQLKESYPVITKPTDQVLQDGKEKCTALIQPAVNRINAVKDFGVNAYTKSTETVSNVAHTATNYSKNQINRATSYGEGVITQALETTYGQVVNDKVNVALELSETYLDKYLPAPETEMKEVVEKSNNALVRAGRVSSKLRRRMYSRAIRDLQNVKVRSTDTLQKLNFTIDLIQYAKSNLDGVKTRVGERVVAAQTKFWDTWTEINRDEIDATGEKSDQNQSLEKRGIVVARHLVHQLRGNLKSLETSMVEMPGTLQDKYRALQEYTDQLWTSFKQMSSVNEVPSWMLNQTRDKLGYIQETMSFLVDQALNSPALSWMVSDKSTSAVTDGGKPRQD